MAIQINDDLLQQLGLGALPQEEKAKLLKQIYDTLEMRVGMKLAEQMTDQQLDEFENFVNTNDEQGAFRWLETNFPNYKDVVAAEFEELKKEIGAVAPQILQSSQQQAAQPVGPPAQAQPSYGPQQPASPMPSAPAPMGQAHQQPQPYAMPPATPAMPSNPPAYQPQTPHMAPTQPSQPYPQQPYQHPQAPQPPTPYGPPQQPPVPGQGGQGYPQPQHPQQYPQPPSMQPPQYGQQ